MNKKVVLLILVLTNLGVLATQELTVLSILALIISVVALAMEVLK